MESLFIVLLSENHHLCGKLEGLINLPNILIFVEEFGPRVLR